MINDHLLISGFVVFILLIMPPLPSEAGLQMGISIGSLNATAWSMEKTRINLELTDGNQFNLVLTADSFSHQALPDALKGIHLECALELQQQSYHCDQGRLRISESAYGPQDLEVSGKFVDREHLILDVQGVQVANGQMNIELKLIEGRWDVALHADRIKLDSLPGAFTEGWLEEGSVFTGIAELRAEARGFREHAEEVDLSLQLADFAYADVEGLRVAEEGGLSLHLTARKKGSDWQGESRLLVAEGQFYADPFFVEVVDEPLQLQLRGQWMPGIKRLQIVESSFMLPQVMETKGSAEIDLTSGDLVEAELRMESDDMGALYNVILQPLLIGTMVDEVEASGVVDIEVSIQDGELQRLHSILKDVNVDDSRELFALYGLSGLVAWSRNRDGDMSELTIAGGQLYRVDFGKLEIRATAQQGEVRLAAPIDLPLMQGTLHIDQLSADGLLGDLPQWTTSAQFRDISLEALAAAFDWPSMEGTLQGTIPRVHYQEKRLELDGELVIDVFGGTIRVGELLVEDPIGRVPELFADLQLTGLDLTQITQTFSFGHITGGLEGEIAALHLASWEPIAFKARFNTPEGDKKPHRISQRAVDNLTALGNGVGSGLSSTFLGFFKEFRYNRIELQAILNGNVAELDGMPHRDGGYYIVKGSGLPRIDVIARNRQVAWKTLLERLKSIRVEGMEMR
ncbi:MAG: hypothetical protein AB2598_00930 [Candidatus Thiodiazotropha sp.]